MDTKKRILKFTDDLCRHAVRKRELYDGANKAVRAVSQPGGDTPKNWAGLMSEEVGEVWSALNRNRLQLAIAECLDVAHSAMLTAFVIEDELDRQRDG